MFLTHYGANPLLAKTTKFLVSSPNATQ